jgi:hypothetical protein
MEDDATTQVDVTQVGVFKSQKPLDRKQLPVLQVLEKYYTPQILRDVLVPIISHAKSTPKSGKLSLRALDWLVTNYAKKNPIIYKVTLPGLHERVVNIYSEYRSWLWKHRRSRFDPFRRRQRLVFKVDGDEHTTTVGQLNFMYWASTYGVLKYARAHLSEIETDHADSTRTAKKTEPEPAGSSKDAHKRKRRQLSAPPRKKVFIYNAPVKMFFNPGQQQ